MENLTLIQRLEMIHLIIERTYARPIRFNIVFFLNYILLIKTNMITEYPSAYPS